MRSPGDLAKMQIVIQWVFDGARESEISNKLQGATQVSSPRTSSSKGMTFRFRHDWIQILPLLLPCWEAASYFACLSFSPLTLRMWNRILTPQGWCKDVMGLFLPVSTHALSYTYSIAIQSCDILSLLSLIISPPWTVVSANFNQYQIADWRLAWGRYGLVGDFSAAWACHCQLEDQCGCL